MLVILDGTVYKAYYTDHCLNLISTKDPAKHRTIWGWIDKINDTGILFHGYDAGNQVVHLKIFQDHELPHS